MATVKNNQYTELRKRLGSRSAVAAMLGVCQKTIERRELGHTQVTPEMVAALEWFGQKASK